MNSEHVTKDTGRPCREPALARVLAIVCVLASLAPVSVKAEWYSEEQALMGTRVSVRLWADSPALASKALESAFREISRIETLMSTYKPASRLSQINRDAARNEVEVDAELYGLLERSLQLSRASGGAFDISYDSVGQHYDFRRGKRPDESLRETALLATGYEFIRLDPARQSVRFLREGVRINLGGIAKGHAVERAVAMLRELGIRNAVVTAGGDSRLLGDRRGRPWMIGVRDPNDREALALRLPLADEAISTSGDYERYFDEDGVRYHHILKPTSGEPASGVRSVSVIGPDALWCDGLSTTLFVLGVEAGLVLIERYPGYEAAIIDTSGRLHYSSGLAAPVHKND